MDVNGPQDPDPQPTRGTVEHHWYYRNRRRERLGKGATAMIHEDTPEMARARREYEAEQKAKAIVEQLGRFVNGLHDVEADAFATALANEHPTLLGQIAKAVGIGVMRRARYDPAWKPYDPVEDRFCDQQVDMAGAFARHAAHDGRLSCTTVIGAELMARQGFI